MPKGKRQFYSATLMRFSAVLAGFVLAGVLLAAPSTQGAATDDIYLSAYRQIQEADQLVSSGRRDMARDLYEQAITTLKRLQSSSPDYSPRAVEYRIDYAQRKLAAIPPAEKKAEAPQPLKPADTVEGLRQQLMEMQKQNQLLQAKLEEALAPRPAGMDPRELAQAQEQIRELEKQKELLRADLEKAAASQPQALDRALVDQLKGELDATKQKLVQSVAEVATLTRELQAARAQNQSPNASTELSELRAALKKEAERAAQLQQRIEEEQKAWAKTRAELEAKLADQAGGQENPNRVRELEKQRDDLMKKLEEANRQPGGQGSTGGAELEKLNHELTNLRARMAVYEARKVPYTQEELALMNQGAPKLATSTTRAARGAIKELPAGAGDLIARAEAAFARRRFAEAEESYQEVLRMDPSNPVTLANLSLIQLEQGKLAEAEKNLQRALELNPQDAYAMSLLGMVRFRQENFDQALNLLSQAAQLDPNNAEIQNYLGITLSQQGQREAAETALRKAVQLSPNYAGAHHNLAVVYATQKPPYTELAKFHYSKARQLGEPAHPDLEAQLKGASN